MKIINLGTSHGDPTPEHYCSSTLLEANGKYYLIDCGEPANASLVRQGLCASQLSAVFITHMHIDHTGSLPVVTEQAAKYRRKYPELALDIILPEAAAIPLLDGWRAANHSQRFNDRIDAANGVRAYGEIRAYDENNGYDDGTLTMQAFQTDHLSWASKDPTIHSYALKITAEGKKVLFTGDLNGSFSDFPLEAANDCDLVFSEITHFPLEKALPTLEKLTAKRLMFYHIGDPWQPADKQKLALDMCSHLPYPVSFAFDGCVTIL